MREIGCFISSHGYGHATRTIAVLEVLKRRYPRLHTHIFTTVPSAIFSETLTDVTFHPILVDIGMVQSSALTVDIPATIQQLDKFLPYPAKTVEALASKCAHLSFILCDIAPLGIAIGKRNQIPSILLENFTWDWIYAAYVHQHPALADHIHFLQELLRQADYHIQTTPVCNMVATAAQCGPIFRKQKDPRELIRKRLNCGTRNVILITMGGFSQQLPGLSVLQKMSDCLFVFPGQLKAGYLGENILLLDKNWGIYHPDLIGAADLVICKAGYSTIAECYQTGARIMVIGREDFPESEPLQRFVESALGGVSLSLESYENGEWRGMIAKRLSLPCPSPAKINGAEFVADLLSGLL